MSRFGAAVIIVIALCLALLGLRQAAASLSMISSNDTVDAIQLQTTPPEQSIDKLIDDQRQSLTLVETGTGWSNLGTALTLKAVLTPERDLQSGLLSQAETALRNSLLLAPGNPYVWLRLAIIARAEHAAPADILQYWRLSAETGPNEDRLFVPRANIALENWQHLSEKDRQFAFADIRHLWKTDHAQIIALLAQYNARNIIRAALAENLSEFMQFEKAVDEQSKH